jgi:3-oxoacyl-[acyl-carrier protein] reductase
MRLHNKIALVTGAGSGFGEGIAKTFAREGCAVVVNDVNADACQRVAQEIRDAGGQAYACVADVAQGACWARMVGCALEDFGGLHIVVNNAGTTHRNQPMLNVPESEFDRIYAVNVKSIYLSAHYAVPLFRAQGGGAFVNIASTAGVRPRPGLTWYNGTKGAVIITSKSMAAELGPENIRVNCINPVIGETGLLSEFMGMPDTPENRAKFLAGIPMGRFSTPQDVANTALFLASDEAAFVTGACVEVDGGRCV